MSLFRRREADISAFVPPRPGYGLASGVPGTSNSLRVSAVWAAARLRADLISTLPVKCYRPVGGMSVEVPTPPVLQQPSSSMSWAEWMWATQFDLDRLGNCFGHVAEWDGAQRPKLIELSDASEWSMQKDSKGVWRYYRKGQMVPNAEVWHERQYVLAGSPLGLSPVAMAAWSIQHNLSAQEFAVQWFTSGAAPAGTLRNRQRELAPDVAADIKARFRAATSKREVFVTGSDWEFLPANGAASDARFLDAMGATNADIARFMGVPADIIDVDSGAGGSITYANITQRNLQLLTLHLGPAIFRRERTFSNKLVATPRTVKLNEGALLRMDESSKVAVIADSINARIMTVSEGRALLERQPLSEEDIAEFERLFGKPRQDQPVVKQGATP